MDQDKLFRKMFEKYNDVFGQACRSLASGQDQLDEQGPEFMNSVHNSIQNWTELPLDKTSPEVTGTSVIDGITRLPDAVRLAEYAAAFCDDDMPDIVKIKLGGFGPAVQEAVLAAIIGKDWESETGRTSDRKPGSQPGGEQAGEQTGAQTGAQAGSSPGKEYDAVVSSALLHLLAEWQCPDCAVPVLEKFSRLREPAEIVAEAVRFFLVDLEPAPVSEIIRHLDEAAVQGHFNPAHEYLLIALTDIGKEHRDDRIFRCLKDSFRKMKNKAIGAICLGDYGDGRAVPALRGWLDQNPDLEDRQVLYEVLSAIRRLGGNID